MRYEISQMESISGDGMRMCILCGSKMENFEGEIIVRITERSIFGILWNYVKLHKISLEFLELFWDFLGILESHRNIPGHYAEVY
jgi:hypothetical protein